MIQRVAIIRGIFGAYRPVTNSENPGWIDVLGRFREPPARYR